MRPEKTAGPDLSEIGSGAGPTSAGSPTGFFRDPSELPGLRRLRANSLAPQRRDCEKAIRQSSIGTAMRYRPASHHVKVKGGSRIKGKKSVRATRILYAEFVPHPGKKPRDGIVIDDFCAELNI
jgi:hypothetical protein